MLNWLQQLCVYRCCHPPLQVVEMVNEVAAELGEAQVGAVADQQDELAAG